MPFLIVLSRLPRPPGRCQFEQGKAPVFNLLESTAGAVSWLGGRARKVTFQAPSVEECCEWASEWGPVAACGLLAGLRGGARRLLSSALLCAAPPAVGMRPPAPTPHSCAHHPRQSHCGSLSHSRPAAAPAAASGGDPAAGGSPARGDPAAGGSPAAVILRREVRQRTARPPE